MGINGFRKISTEQKPLWSQKNKTKKKTFRCNPEETVNDLMIYRWINLALYQDVINANKRRPSQSSLSVTFYPIEKLWHYTNWTLLVIVIEHSQWNQGLLKALWKPSDIQISIGCVHFEVPLNCLNWPNKEPTPEMWLFSGQHWK